jgi:hypothetical protein
VGGHSYQVVRLGRGGRPQGRAWSMGMADLDPRIYLIQLVVDAALRVRLLRDEIQLEQHLAVVVHGFDGLAEDVQARLSLSYFTMGPGMN